MTKTPPCPERTRPARRLVLAALAGLALVLVPAGCASSARKPAAGGSPIRVTWRDYRTGNLLELLSESHTSKVELYSEKRDSASVKVQEDRFMEGLLEFLELEHFAERAGAGRAPREGRELWTQSLEVERDGEVTHMAVGSRSPADDRLVFQRCVQGFIELYNATQAYQAVENPEGSYEFRSADRGRSGS